MVTEEKTKRSLGIAWVVLLAVVLLTILTFIFVPLWISLICFIVIYSPTILYILIYKWIKRWFAAAVFSFSIWLNILIILIPVAGGLLFLDLNNFKDNFETQPKYLAIEDNGIIFAAKINSLELSEESFKVLTPGEITSLQTEINNNLVQDKMIFLVNKEVFNVVETIQQPETGITLTREEAFNLIKSEDPFEILRSKMPANIPSQLLTNMNLSSETIKIFTLALLLQETIKKGGPEYLINELKSGNIKIYPERTSLKILIKVVPTEMITGLLSDSLPESPMELTKETPVNYNSPMNSNTRR